MSQTAQTSRFRNRKRAVALLAAGSLTAFAGTVAYAYWSTSGTGSAAAPTATASHSLSFTTASISAMYPGDSAQPLTVTVKNTGTQKQYVANVSAYLTIDSNHSANCTASDYLLNGTAAPGTAATAAALSWTPKDLAANGTQDATGTIQFNDKPVNQDGCQGATVTLNYSAN